MGEALPEAERDQGHIFDTESWLNNTWTRHLHDDDLDDEHQAEFNCNPSWKWADYGEVLDGIEYREYQEVVLAVATDRGLI